MTGSGNHRGITASVVALMIVAGAGYLDYYILQNGLPKSGSDSTVVTMILTAWNGLAGIVASYFYGNSANSDRKTEILANSTPAQTTTATTADATITSTPAPTQQAAP